jgi:DNA-binding PucR family transcriptional regulator
MSALRYDLERRHTAAVVWRDGLGPGDPAALEQVAEAIAAAAGAGRPLTVLPNATTLWAWFGAPREPPPLPRLRRAIDPAGGVRVALGTSGSGLDGFRRGHLHALTTQRLMRRAAAAIPLAGYDELRLIALAGADEEAAAEFTAAILGELADADPQLRETLRVYIREGFSASRAARALFAHRNTVLARLSRARELLPVSLESDGLEVGLALELARWLRGG